MPREKSSVSREDYLKTIWETIQEGQETISARLAKDLAAHCATRRTQMRLVAGKPR